MLETNLVGAGRRCAARGALWTNALRLRLDPLFVFIVRADEEPNDDALSFEAKSTMPVVNANGPKAPDLLKAKGWMRVIAHPEAVLLSGPLLDFRT